MTLNLIAAVCKAVVALGYDHTEIQAVLNEIATGNRSDSYALVQRQKQMAEKV